MRKRCNTPPRMSRARATNSAVVPPPWWTRASAWASEIPTDPRRKPFANPACSINHAAGTLERPSPIGNVGRLSPGSRAPQPRASSVRAASDGASKTGLMKNEPTLRELGSVVSTTIDFARRSSSTALRTSTAVGAARRARRARSSCGYFTLGVPPRSSRNVTASTRNRPGFSRKLLVR